MTKSQKSSVDITRRKLIKVGSAATAFAVPMIASFSRDGLTVASTAEAKRPTKHASGKKSGG